MSRRLVLSGGLLRGNPTRRLGVLATLIVSVVAGLTLAGSPVLGAGRPTTRVLFGKCANDSHYAGGVHPGGDWPAYSHDLANTRDQLQEHLIGAGNVAKLGPVWTFSTQAAGAHGDFVGTPVEAGGCVYAGTAGGFIFAINADSGKLVWRQKVTGDINNSLAVHDGVVYAGITDTTFQPCGGLGCDGPYVAAFDAQTGRRIWKTLPVDTQQGSDIYSSPVIFDPRPAADQARGDAAGGACRSTLRLPINLRLPRGAQLVSASVYLNGRLVRVLKGSALRGPVVLRGLPTRSFTVRIVGIAHRRGRPVKAGRDRERDRERDRDDPDGDRDDPGYAQVVATHRYAGCPASRLVPLLIEGVSAWAAEGEHSLAQEGPRAAFEGNVFILNALNGQMLARVWTIHPPAGQCPASTCPKGTIDDHLSGAGVWSSAAVDPAAKVAYLATANPYQPEAASPHADAILEIGIDQTNPATFGKVIASASGTPDTYLPTLQHAPCVNPPTVLDLCFDQDLDFGSSPNLFTDAAGHKVVGDGQKSGVYWAFDRATMQPLWSTIVGPPSLVGGVVGTSAYDGHNLYGSITENGGLWSLDATSGASRWSPTTSLQDGEHYGTPMSFANGVAYTTTDDGHVAALDPATGQKLANLSLSQGTQTGSNPVSTYGGVAIARDTVYAAVGVQGNPDGFIIAYRLGGKGSPPPATAPPYPTGVTSDGDPNNASATVIAPPGAQSAGFATGSVTITQGSLLAFRNLDELADHNVTSVARDASGKPLFASESTGAGNSVIVNGVKKLPPGTYAFYCSIHPNMTGTLTVTK